MKDVLGGGRLKTDMRSPTLATLDETLGAAPEAPLALIRSRSLSLTLSLTFHGLRCPSQLWVCWSTSLQT